MSGNLQPLDPERTLKLYLDARRDEITEQTLRGHRNRLRAFVAWCEEEEIENLNELAGRDLYAYRVWRREGNFRDSGEELALITLRGNLATLRAFLRFFADIDAVDEELFTQVPLPAVSTPSR